MASATLQDYATKALRHEEKPKVKVEKAKGAGAGGWKAGEETNEGVKIKKAPDPFFPSSLE